jgi:hypothetical protein
MQPSTILLESDNPWGPLHPECSILDLLCSDQHRDGFLYLVFADAYPLLAVAVEEGQVWCYGMLCAWILVRHPSIVHGAVTDNISVCFTTIYRMTTLASSSKGTDLTCKFQIHYHMKQVITIKTDGPVPATNWSVIEANTGLICTCLPMLNQYIKVFTGFFSRSSASTSPVRPGNTPRSGKFGIGLYNISAKSDKDEIFGTGRQWGAVDSTVESRRDMLRTESQENMVGDKKIHRKVDVEMWHTDGRSDESLKI